jgi:hypothetical protein
MLTLFSMHEKSYLASCPDDACTGKGGSEVMLGECQMDDKSEA